MKTAVVPPTSVSCTEKNPGLRSTTLRSLARAALAALDRPRATVSIVLTGDDEIRALNRDFRESDHVTDVLSFPFADPESLHDPAVSVFLGEIYIALPRARKQAASARRPLAREVAHLTVHGILHLIGHDHHRVGARRRMVREERRLLRVLGKTIDRL
jgi:probable rRNA maturation factor